MKKFISILLLIALCVLMIGCGKSGSEKPSGMESLTEVEEYLKEKNVVSGEKTEVLAEMIGATSGFKYLDSNVEVYEYDTKSDTYKNLEKTNTVELKDFGMTLTASAINGKYVLFCEDATNKDEIITIFKDMK